MMNCDHENCITNFCPECGHGIDPAKSPLHGIKGLVKSKLSAANTTYKRIEQSAYGKRIITDDPELRGHSRVSNAKKKVQQLEAWVVFLDALIGDGSK